MKVGCSGRTQAHRRPALESLEGRRLLAVTIMNFPSPRQTADLWTSRPAPTATSGSPRHGADSADRPDDARHRRVPLPDRERSLYTQPAHVRARRTSGSPSPPGTFDQVKVGQINPTTHAIAEFPISEIPWLTHGRARRQSLVQRDPFRFDREQIGMIDPRRTSSRGFPTAALPPQITSGPDGNLWFTGHTSNVTSIIGGIGPEPRPGRRRSSASTSRPAARPSRPRTGGRRRPPPPPRRRPGRVPGAGLAAVDLLQGEHVGVQRGDGRREPVGVDVGVSPARGRRGR